MSVEETLKQEESWRASVYDDATGQPITKGTLVQGYPTIGFGMCVDAFKGTPMPKEVGELWLQMLEAEKRAGLTAQWQPFLSQPAEVRDALVLMAYQLGVEGVLGFKLMLAALAKNDREAAAVAALNSQWHVQTKDRCERVADMIRGHKDEGEI
jgi:lysozyme